MPAKRTAPNNGGQDAVALLKKDHERVRGLLRKLEKARDRNRQRNIFAQVDNDLQIHIRIEEEIFYPAFRNGANGEQKRLYFEALQEHHVVEMILPGMRTSSLSKEVFAAKVKVLKDLVERHIEQEETQILPKARKAIGVGRLKDLGTRIQARKNQLSFGTWDQSLEVMNPFVRRTLTTPSRRNTGRSASKNRAA
jgi:hemerythrin-like domain-containing protein